MTHQPKTIGLLGGVASGKTTAARMMGRLGAAVIDADRIAHQVLQHPGVVEQVRREWGEDVLDPAGRVDRGKLGRKVFGDPAQIQKLNAIVHPLVLDEMRSQIAQARERGVPAVALDAALLVEAGFEHACDVLVFIDTPEAQRQSFSRDERGWPADEVGRRESHQTPLERKRHMAHYVVCNDGTLDDLFAQVREIWAAVIP